MDAFSVIALVVFAVGVILALVLVDMGFGDYDDKDDWRRR